LGSVLREVMQSKDTMPEKSLPENFDSLESFWEFWDTHSSADFEEWMEPVEFEIDVSSDKFYCAISKDVMLQIQQAARQQGVSAETLVNLWLQAKLKESIKAVIQ
jgi:hypothetical protein